MRLGVIAAAALAVASCQSGTQTGAAPLDQRIAAAQGAEVEQVCFTGSVADWRRLRRDLLLIEQGDDWYKIDLGGACDAEWAHARISERSRVEGSSCLSAGDRVEAHALGGSSSCSVRAIHAWNE